MANIAKKTISFLLVSIFLISLASAVSIGKYEQDKEVVLFQTCNNCSYCNFTRMMTPSNQTIIFSVNATRDGTYYFLPVNSGNFSEVGGYKYCYDCGNEIETLTGCIDFEVGYNATPLTLQIGLLYLISITVLIFFFALLIALIHKLPNEDATDEEGTILQISHLKHFRSALWAVAWLIILAMLFIVSNMAIAYLPSRMVGNLFWTLWRIMFYFTLIAIPLWFIWIFWKFFQDREFKRMIERGVNIKSSNV